MGIRIHNALNPNYEILGLLYTARHPETLEKAFYLRMVQEQGVNLDGGELYERIGGVHKRYVNAFCRETPWRSS